jgi:subtilisin family serine protease
MNILPLVVMCIVLISLFSISLCSWMQTKASEFQGPSGRVLILAPSGHLLQNSELSAKARTTEAENRISRPASKSRKSNVIISEPANCSDGRDMLGICALHAQNFSGKNITIAVIDYEFYVDRLSERELPRNRIIIINNTYTEYERHGTACSEIIGDIAPNATLYMIGAKDASEDGFKEAVDRLLHLNTRIDIVSCSMDFPSSLFEESDYFCSTVRNLTENGTIWINAAGDEARRHWHGTFRDENGNGFNEFVPGNEALQVTMKKRMPLKVYLSWNDSWSRSCRDYDLYVFAPDGSYTISKNRQNGYQGQKPIEVAALVAPVRGNYSIKIKNYSASPDNAAFQLFTNEDLSEYNIENFSVGVLASCPEVITVGAVDASTLKLENFSSMGPTLDGRLKPELVAPDNITTSSYLPEKFKGSSASAPYAAGIFALALEKGRKLGLPDAEIERLLLDNAIDLGPPGPDNGYGYGLINLNSFAELKEEELT